MLKSLFSGKYPKFTDILLFFGLYFVTSTIVAFVVLLVSNSFDKSINITDVSGAISYVLTFAIMILVMEIYRGRKRANFKPLRLLRKHSPTSPMFMLWGVISVVAISFITNPLLSYFPSSLEMLYSYMNNMGVYLILTCVIAAPILEELVFRGIIQSDLEARFGGVKSIIITSFIFSIIHLNPAQILSAFFISLVLGIMYYETKSLWTVIFIHFFNNAASIILFKLHKDGVSFEKPYKEYFENVNLYYTVYAISLIIFSYTIYKLVTIKKTLDSSQNTSESEAKTEGENPVQEVKNEESDNVDNTEKPS